MTENIQAIVTELRPRLQMLYGERLVHVVLYGSQARGDAAAGSDIDMLVVLRGPVNAGAEIERTGGTVADLFLRFDEVITCVFIDESSYRHRQGPLLHNIRREGIVV